MDLLSLAFEEEGFQLPTIHDFETVAAATRGQRVCFEEWAFASNARHGGQPGRSTRNRNATRTPEEADRVRRLAYKRCSIPMADGVVRALTVPPKLLFFERFENRLIVNAPELCDRLRPVYETWLFQEPADLGFCAQVRAVHWADLIVTKTGSHAEYVGLAARRGSVWILVHSYPLAVGTDKFGAIRTAFMPGIRLFDLPLFDDASIGSGEVDSEAAVAIGAMRSNLASIWALCELVSFGTVRLPGRHQCERLLIQKDSFVDPLTLEPYLVAAVNGIQSGDFDASNPCFSSYLLCEPREAVRSCRADRQCNFAVQILNAKEIISHENMSFVPSTWTWNVEEVRLRRKRKRSNLHEDHPLRSKATSSNTELRHVMETLASNNSDLGFVQAACAFFERAAQARDSTRCQRYLEQVAMRPHKRACVHARACVLAIARVCNVVHA
jgi:hypothetical protein